MFPILLLALPAAALAQDADDDDVAVSTSAAGADEEEEGCGPTLELGVAGSMGREANVEDHDWGPKVSLDVACTPYHLPFAVGYGLQASYNDAETKLRTAESSSRTRTRFVDLRYAKVSFLKLFGFEIPKLGFTPYVAAGAQYADQRSEDIQKDPPGPDELTITRDYYWSTTWGFGAEVPIGTRATLVVDVDQNTRGGLRYNRRLSVELKFRILGEE